MTTALERNLQTEIMYRLARYPVIAIPVPNGVWLPVRRGDEGKKERELVGKIINRMKATGMLIPGAPDLILLSAKGGICVELKRGRTKDLLGTRPAGRLSSTQRDFQRRCENAGVPYLVAYCWEDVQCNLGALC